MTKHTPYPAASSNPSFPEMEEKILARWGKENIFQQSVTNRPAQIADSNNEFIFYDGPPFANGLPHYGHLLTGYVKDIVARYQTMQGKRVERRFGWDCHGLPAEMGAEKELGISGRIQITEFGIDKFNDHCRSSVMRYTNEWEDYVTRQARWVDFEHSYKTMDTNYMESVMWAFKQLHEKGLVYESMRVMPYSWACETPLSNFETRMDNSYRKKESKAATVAFTLKDKPKAAPEGCAAYKVLAWTTTPWTLPSNLALAVGKDIDYVAIAKEGICYITAKSALKTYEKELGVEVVANFKGSDLVGLNYEPLFPYFKNTDYAFRILSADFVTDTDGTGIVHLAPGFGEDDFAICVENEIPVICPVDNAGKFTDEMHDIEGLSIKGKQVFETNDDIIKHLKTTGAWLRTEQYIHDYPHCWRTDTPLIYKAVPSWYVEVTKFRDRMVELNQQINWMPGHVKDGLFGKWLENARDWSISRNRFWGSPIPVWKSDNPHNKELYVFGSIKELEDFFGVEVKDLHKPFIDDLTKPDPLDPQYTLKRVPDVFDCWFESGSMPYAQAHYPFENKEWFEKHFPADFIVEYAAQTRGWFYTLMVLSTALFDRPPFLNCICHGVILDEKGQKLSKRLNNYADPKAIFAEYGADALRWLMVSSPVMRGMELLIDKEGKMVRDVLRLSIKPIWNSYHFFTLYANSDGITAQFITQSDNLMDSYILAKLKDAVEHIKHAMDNYDTPSACAAVEGFFEVLNNWYIRRCRPRFWKTEKDADKQAAYDTLYTVLHVMCRAAAPLLPLLTEAIYLGLTENKKSVHLENFPDVSAIAEEKTLLSNMDKVRDACNAALSIRNAQNIRIRQPLSSITLMGEFSLNDELKELISDEVNVKKVLVAGEESIQEHADYKLQINFPVLGKRLPAKMKQIIPASKKGEWKRLPDGTVEILGEVLTGEECSLMLDPKDKTAAQALSTNDALVMLDILLTPELKAEGIARDVVRAIQQARKDADLNVADRISVLFEASDDIADAIKHHETYITDQTLAVSLVAGTVDNQSYISESEMDGQKVRVGISVV